VTDAELTAEAIKHGWQARTTARAAGYSCTGSFRERMKRLQAKAAESSPAPVSAPLPSVEGGDKLGSNSVVPAWQGYKPRAGWTAPEATEIEWTGARPASSSTGVERRIVIGDIHFPAHSASALAAVYALVRALQPRKVIQVGDLVNSAAFTNHQPHSPEPERYDLSMMAARGFIRSIKRAAPGADLYIVRGNHDDWASRWEAANPALQGSFDFEVGLGIRSLPDDDRPPPFPDVRVVRHAESNPLVLGPVAYAHGNGGGLHFAKRYAENNGPRSGVRVMRVGHHHALQVYCHRNGHECWGVGWVGNEDHPAFHYAPPPRAWWVGVLVEDVVGSMVTTTPVPIVNGAALFGARVIEARARAA
jgi:predicted phosphodiesterase